MTYEDIKQQITEILSDEFESSKVVNALGNVIMSAIGITETLRKKAMLDMSIQKTIDPAMTLTRSGDLGYSVNRGTNQKITLSNYQIFQEFSTKKFDLAGSVNSYNLYYLETKTYQPGNINTIELIVSPKVEKDIELTNSLKSLIVPSEHKNISETLLIERLEVDGSRTELPYSKQYVDENTIVDITQANYSTKFYRLETFSKEKYYLSYIPYDVSTKLTENDIKSVSFSNFVITDNSKISIQNPIEREESSNEIYLQILRKLSTIGSISSKDDIINVFMNLYGTIVQIAELETGVSKATVYYKGKDYFDEDGNVQTYVLPDGGEAFKQQVKSYLLDNLEIEIKNCQEKQITFNYYLDAGDPSAEINVSDFISNYTKLNTPVDPWEIMTSLSKIDYVNSIIFSKLDEASLDNWNVDNSQYARLIGNRVNTKDELRN